jgi:hypothetical protein
MWSETDGKSNGRTCLKIVKQRVISRSGAQQPGDFDTIVLLQRPAAAKGYSLACNRTPVSQRDGNLPVDNP